MSFCHGKQTQALMVDKIEIIIYNESIQLARELAGGSAPLEVNPNS